MLIDLDSFENQCSIPKTQLHSDGTQYSSNGDLWQAVLTTVQRIPSSGIKKLTFSMDRRLILSIVKRGHYNNYLLL